MKYSFNFSVTDYIAAGIDSKLVDPDGGIHVHRLQAQIKEGQVSTVQPPIPHTLPQDGWTSSLLEFPPFNYGCLYAHLVTNSKAIAENQCSAAVTNYRAGGMKHKEEGYRLFKMNM